MGRRVGKCVEVWEEVRGGEGRYGERCEEKCERVYGVSVEGVGICEKMCWYVRRCEKMLEEPTHFSTPPPITLLTLSHFHQTPLPNLPHTHPSLLFHTPHSPDTPLHTHLTPSHFPPHLPSPPPHLSPTLT